MSVDAVIVPRLCGCGCGRRIEAGGGRLYVSSQVKYATPACSHRAMAVRAAAARVARWQRTLEERRAAHQCPRCGGTPEPDRVHCASCLVANRARAERSRVAGDLPMGVVSTRAIDRRYQRALGDIRRRRVHGDPAWSVDGWAQRPGLALFGEPEESL